MHVPLWALIPIAILAAMTVVAIAAIVHVAMTDDGRRLFGRRDLYLENHVLEERWYALYVCIHVRIAAHSYSSL